MTNELGTTLDDIQAKAERKREALKAINLNVAYLGHTFDLVSKPLHTNAFKALETIRKYIEES